jgi:hypothetical protein
MIKELCDYSENNILSVLDTPVFINGELKGLFALKLLRNEAMG